MQITSFDRPATPPAPQEGDTAVRARGTGTTADLADAYLEAAKALSADLIRQGARTAHIRALTIIAPDPDALRTRLPEIDLRHREALSGNFGETVALVKGDAIMLEAHGLIPPASDAAVWGGYDRAALNAQYSPSSNVPEAGDILAAWRIDGSAYQTDHAVEVNYGPAPAHRLDLYRPDPAPGLPPLHVLIHGGYWQALDKRDNGHLARELVKAGVTVAALNYPLCPPGTVDKAVDACRLALAYLVRNAGTLGVDAGRITVSGHSAGGHLAAMLACTDWTACAPDLPADPIRGTLAISGVFEAEPLVYTDQNNALRLSVEEARAVSPASHPLTSSGPVIAAVGGAESDEFRRQSRAFADARGARYLEVANRNHFTVMEALADPDSYLYTAALTLAQNA